jgi:predicted PurR-regulated permease PerM
MTLPPQSPSASAKSSSRPKRADASKVMTVFVLIVVALYFGREVLVPVTLALLLTFLLAPAVGWFRRIHLGRVPSVVLVVTLALGVLIGIGGVIVGQLRELTSDLPNYVSAVETKVATVKLDAMGRLSHAMKVPTAHNASSPKPLTQVTAHQGTAPPPVSPGASPSAVAPTALPQATSTPWQLAAEYISPILSPVATVGIVFVVAVFALLQREDLRDRLIRLIGSDDIHRTTLALDDAGRRLTRYFLTQLTVNATFGSVIGVGLYFIGVPRPILWGLLTAILRFIPYLGSFISALLPVELAAAVEPGWSMAVWTLSFYVVAEALTGQVLEPLIYGHGSGLSPFSVIVAALFWSWVWGPVGLFLSTPLTLCLAVIGRHVKGLESLDIALGDKPALTPTESFYQRILADDADEVLAQAELLLKDMSLARYYDEVALPGMQLAANDVELGVLTAEQQESVKETIYELVAGLSEHEARNPTVVKVFDPNDLGDDEENEAIDLKLEPTLTSGAPFTTKVLSIAGRGPLDEPGASMLAQLLAQRGIASKMIKDRDVSRYSIESLDTTAVGMICIAYLNISGSPANLRYLVQRLRKHIPDIPIVIGLWPEDNPALQQAQQQIGADYFASSFESVLQQCEAGLVKSRQQEARPLLAA